MMSSGGSNNNDQRTTQVTEVPRELRRGFANLGAGATESLERIRTLPTFSAAGANRRGSFAQGRTGGTGVDPRSFATTLQTGGFTPFNRDDLAAQSQARQVAGGISPEIGQAGNIFRNNAGIGQLRDLDFGGVAGFSPEELQSLRFEDLQETSSNPAFDYLTATARGDYLSPDSNPFLADAIRAAQDPVLEAFQQDILPGITGQFGGGFGLGGSAAINATRRAGEDVSGALSRDATQAYAQAYQQERGLQEGASQFLGGLDLQRALGLGELDLSRAGQIDQLGLESELGLGELELGRGSALGSLENQQAQGLLGVGNERRQQELQNIELLANTGAINRQQAAELYAALERDFNAPVDDELQRLLAASQLLGVNQGGTTTTTASGGGGGTNRLTSAAGGAITGAALGSPGGLPGILIGGGLGGLAGVL